MLNLRCLNTNENRFQEDGRFHDCLVRNHRSLRKKRMKRKKRKKRMKRMKRMRMKPFLSFLSFHPSSLLCGGALAADSLVCVRSE